MRRLIAGTIGVLALGAAACQQQPVYVPVPVPVRQPVPVPAPVAPSPYVAPNPYYQPGLREYRNPYLPY